MSIIIDHIVIPAHDHEASAQFFAGIMGVDYAGPDRHFAPVRVSDTFTIAFMKEDQFTSYHLGFHIGEDEFDVIFSHLQAAGVPYGNHPFEPTNIIA
jgi:catechol 2,3-dioxygenase-like lactoylglutathione lyase family enzyme